MEKESEDLKDFMESSGHISFKTFEVFSKNEATRNAVIDFIYPKERRMLIDKNWFLIGRNWYNAFNERDRGDKMFLPFGREVFRCVLFGKMRSGKSMLIRRLGDTAFLNQYHVIYLTDVKNEMRTSKNPQHQHISRNLDSLDIPQGFPTKVYRPLYFKEFFNESEPPEDNEYFQLPYKLGKNTVMDWIDFQTLLGLKQKDDKALQLLSLYWQEADSLENLKDIISKVPKSQATKATVDKIIRAIEPLIKYKVFGSEANKDLILDLQGNIVVFNVRGFERLTGESALSNVPSMYVKLIQKLVIDAKEEKSLKRRVLMVIDEAPVFLRAGTLTAREIENTVKRQTHLGIYIVFAAQDINDVPSWIINMSRYIFFPYNFEFNSLKKILEQIDLSNTTGTWVWSQDLANIKSKMSINEKTGERQFGLIDTQKKRLDILWPYPSLSEHLLTGI